MAWHLRILRRVSLRYCSSSTRALCVCLCHQIAKITGSSTRPPYLEGTLRDAVGRLPKPLLPGRAASRLKTQPATVVALSNCALTHPASFQKGKSNQASSHTRRARHFFQDRDAPSSSPRLRCLQPSASDLGCASSQQPGNRWRRALQWKRASGTALGRSCSCPAFRCASFGRL